MRGDRPLRQIIALRQFVPPPIAPSSSKRDPKLYELLALLDSIRGGRAREREIAIRELKKRLDKYAPSI
jgi:hypothetical protein